MKKKAVKKARKKTTAKKVVKRRKRKKVEVTLIEDIETFLRVVNSVQLKKVKTKVLVTDLNISPIMENILRDTNLDFNKRVMKKGISYYILPNFEDVIVDVDVHELEDEFLEDGQLF